MDKNNTTLVAVVVALLALLLGCVAGAVFGGTAAYLLATRGERAAPEQYAPEPIPERLVPTTPIPPVEPEMRGTAYALVTSVTSNSPAERAGLQVGDMITQVNGKEVGLQGPAEIIALHEPGDSIVVTILRFGEEQQLQATLGSNPENPDQPWLGITYQLIPAGLQHRILPDED